MRKLLKFYSFYYIIRVFCKPKFNNLTFLKIFSFPIEKSENMCYN